MRNYLLMGVSVSLLLLAAAGCASSDTRPGDSQSASSTGTGSGGAGSASASSSQASGASSSGSSGEPDAGDGLYHPPGDGTHITEDTACNLLSDAQNQRRAALSCPGTSLACPDLLRSMSKIDCLEYDQGSVQGCVVYYGKAMNCTELTASFNKCVIASFAGSQPKGCP